MIVQLCQLVITSLQLTGYPVILNLLLLGDVFVDVFMCYVDVC